MILIKRIETNDAFYLLREPWNRLLDSSGINSAFLTWEWLYTWWKHFGSGKKLFILTAWQDGDLIGIAPLMKVSIKKRGFELKKICSNAMMDADVSGLIFPSGQFEVCQALCDEIARELGNEYLLELSEFPATCINPTDLNQYFNPGLFAHNIKPSTHYYFTIKTGWQEYYQSLSRPFKRKIKRRASLIAENGHKATFHHFQGCDVKPEHLDILFQINEKGHYPLSYVKSSVRVFHKDLADCTSKNGWTSISFMYLDDQPVAYEYGFIYLDRYEVWKRGFDKEFEAYTPGNLLCLNNIEYSCQKGLSQIDWLRGDESYKKRWPVMEKEHNIIQIIPKKSLKMMALYSILPRLKSRIQRRMNTVKNDHFDQTD